MNFDDFLRQGEIRRKMQSYIDKREKAVAVAADAIASHQRVYVSVSGGKDSVVCACIADEAARRTGRELILWAHVSDASFPGTEETIGALADQLGRELEISRSDGSAYDALRNPQRRAFGKTGVFFDSIRDWVRQSGCDMCLTGVRAYESKRRMQAAKAHGSCFHSGTGGDIDICNPITWFRLEDVAAALLDYRAPVHPIYRKCAIGTRENKFAEDGFIRLGYITSRDILNKGTLVFLRLNYPEEWQKLCEAWPEARNYC